MYPLRAQQYRVLGLPLSSLHPNDLLSLLSTVVPQRRRQDELPIGLDLLQRQSCILTIPTGFVVSQMNGMDRKCYSIQLNQMNTER